MDKNRDKHTISDEIKRKSNVGPSLFAINNLIQNGLSNSSGKLYDGKLSRTVWGGGVVCLTPRVPAFLLYIGAGVGIGVVFGALILGVARNPS